MEGKPLQLLTKEELLQEISSNLPELISDPDFILDYKLRVLSLSPDSRREFIEETSGSLKNNNQSLGAFLVSKSGTRLPPTVSNWIKDFGEFAGTPVDESKKDEYLNSPDFKKIDVGARTILNNLFEFYELLVSYQEKPDQISRTLVKDESGKMKIIDKGDFLDFEQKAPKPAPPRPLIRTEPPVLEEKKEPVKEILPEKKIFPTPPPKAVAASYLHPEDEEEIKSHKNNLSAYSLPELSGAQAVVQTIIEENNLSFPDDILKKRFISIASSFLKGIRNKRDTLELLTKPAESGGLEYSGNLAEKIITELEENESKMYAQKTIGTKTLPSVPSPQQALERSLAERKILKKETAEEAPVQMSGQQYDIPEPIKTTEPAPMVSSVKKEMTEPEIFKPEPEEQKFRIKRPIFSAKRKVEDIKGKSQIMGPIDELNNLSLNDFHRLGTEKISSVDKIFDKINLLKEDSFAKYAEGIKAWRKSEVCKLYLEMGSESMEQQKNIGEIIQTRRSSNLPYLTVSQFNEIADLNKKLRY